MSSGTRAATALEYVPALRRLLVEPLAQVPPNDADGAIETARDMMSEYGLLRDDFVSINDLSQFSNMPVSCY